MNIITNFLVQCIHINYISCKSIAVYLKLEVYFWLKLNLWIILTFSVVDTSSVFFFNRKLTFGKDDVTLNEFFILKNVSVNTMEIKVGSSLNSLCSVELSYINDILINDFSSYEPCIMHVVVSYLFFSFWLQ